MPLNFDEFSGCDEPSIIISENTERACSNNKSTVIQKLSSPIPKMQEMQLQHDTLYKRRKTCSKRMRTRLEDDFSRLGISTG